MVDQDLAGLTKNGLYILAELSSSIQVGGRFQGLKPLRKRAVDMILAAAMARHLTTGKWMLFPAAQDVTLVWKVVADATASGELGIGAKVATADVGGEAEMFSKKARLICVYTRNFSDAVDVHRVLFKLHALGIAQEVGPPWIYYKCGAFKISLSPRTVIFIPIPQNDRDADLSFFLCYEREK